MVSTDTVLRFEFSSNPNADARTVQVLQVIDESGSTAQLYKVCAIPPLSFPIYAHLTAADLCSSTIQTLA